MRAAALTVLATFALSACAQGAKPLKIATLPAATNRALAATFQDQPFDTGPVTVIATEHGQLHSFTLAPCRGGDRICSGSISGRAGKLEITPDYAVVSGLYGRTFFLSPGGDGYLDHHGVQTPIAWDDASATSHWAVTATSDQGIVVDDPM